MSWTWTDVVSCPSSCPSRSAMIVCKSVHGLVPMYAADNCLAISTIAGKWHLKSAGTRSVSVPRTRTTLGMRSFADFAGQVIWNSLPTAMWSVTLSPSTFAEHLKANVFSWLIAYLRTIYDTLYKSTHHHHHHHHAFDNCRFLLPYFPCIFCVVTRDNFQS